MFGIRELYAKLNKSFLKKVFYLFYVGQNPNGYKTLLFCVLGYYNLYPLAVCKKFMERLIVQLFKWSFPIKNGDRNAPDPRDFYF